MEGTLLGSLMGKCMKKSKFIKNALKNFKNWNFKGEITKNSKIYPQEFPKTSQQ